MVLIPRVARFHRLAGCVLGVALGVPGLACDGPVGGTAGRDAGPRAESPIRLIFGADVLAGATLHLSFKRERPSRTLVEVERSVTNAEAAEGAALLDWPAVAGEGPVYLHARVLQASVSQANDQSATDARASVDRPDDVVAVGYAALEAQRPTPVEMPAYRPECDRDGDGQFSCRDDCCDAVPVAVRPFVLDCLDDTAEALALAARNGGGLLLADTKRRRAAEMHAFRPAERADDYASCSNGLDDDCQGGDLACERRLDADRDGAGIATDCDDADPGISPDAPEMPGDGVDQNCDGRDAAGTDRDLDGYTARGDDGGPPDCDDTDPDVAPGRRDAPCDGVDQDCDGADLCAADGRPDLDGDGRGGAEDCDDRNPDAFVDHEERCADGVDQDCDGVDPPCAPDDLDGDGHTPPADCDDADPATHPGAPERCADAIDQDCDGADLDCALAVDLDGDAFPAPGDCADRDPLRHPGAAERCNALDDDCDAVADENTTSEAPLERCRNECGPGRWLCLRGQALCALGVPAAETCNGRDDDCDGEIDDHVDPLCYDAAPTTAGVGVCRAGRRTCVAGVPSACIGQVLPAESDRCNGLDDDCDGAADNTPPSCYPGSAETRGRGRCHAGVQGCDGGEPGPCVGAVGPEPETCNGLDDDCNGETDEGLLEACEVQPGATEDCRVLARVCTHGAWGPCGPQRAGSAEVCDAVDNDCNGLVDEGFDVYADPANCGVCGRRCGAGERCCAGACLAGALCGLPSGDCTLDADCGSPTPYCVGGRCRGCRPENHEGCEETTLCCAVAGEAVACVPADEGSGCEACGARCDPGAADVCVGRQCGCGVGPPCTGDAPFCLDGRCVACTEDAECNGALGGNHCVAGVCRACDPESHSGCAPGQLCCGERCVLTRVGAACEACGEACPADRADVCTGRVCACGEGPVCPDATPYCLLGACAACRDGHDEDCGAAGLRCDGGRCVGCDASGCPDDSARPVCGADDTCRACENDAECGAAAVGHQCVAGRCASCDPADAGGCLPAGPRPICDAAARSCRACAEDAECSAARPACVTGACRPCREDTHVGCDESGARPVCVAGNCEPCERDDDCRLRPGGRDTCEAGRCVLCRRADGAGCGRDAVTPICDALGGLCRGCRSDADCASAGRGDTCLVDGRCGACDPARPADCGAQVCFAGRCEPCHGEPDCVGHAAGPRCAGGFCGP